jgi:uncharacterized protein (DUF1684 family)
MKIKYCLAFLLLISVKSFAQDHKTMITAYRKQYMADFLSDAHSPLKKDDLQFLRFYDDDSTYSVTATVKLLAKESPFVIPAFSGTGGNYERYALVSFTLKGKPMQLTLYKSLALAQNPLYADYLFLPFTDDTNGQTTYGGGRYIDMRTGDIKEDKIIVDFNKAYNPYCAFSSGDSCPKPPGENRLAVAVEAGEKVFAGAKVH